MNSQGFLKSGRIEFLLLALLVLLAAPPVVAGPEGECAAAGGYSFICGMTNPEDLVRVPGTKWVIASSMAPDGSIYLIDTGEKTFEALYPGAQPAADQDMERYAACPGAPAPGSLISHGLSLQPGSGQQSTLFVVGHGGREAIEVFTVDAGGDKPTLTWVGCVLTPDGMAANSVASLADGSLLATIPLRSGIQINEALGGKATGGVYSWSPGDAGFVTVEGTEMPYANGIEVSTDGREFYVASSGLFSVTAFSNTNPAKLLRRSETLSFLPDNLHRDDDGRLITAGLNLVDPICGEITPHGAFDFEAFMACPRAFTVWAIEPETLQGRALATGAANPKFSNITMALTVDNELWIGTFAGDRVAYRILAED